MAQKNEAYFVTGSAGFIGSHMVESLLADGHSVTGYDDLSSGRKEWMGHLQDDPRFTFIQANLLELGKLTQAMEGHDVVIHLAANTDIRRGNSDYRVDLENCTLATYNVLEAMRSNNVGELLFASSATVYGDQWEEPLDEGKGPLLPISLYGAAKLSCESIISAYCHLNDIRAWIFRFGNVVGARMGHGVLYDFIAKLRRNPQELEVLGDGEQQKNYFMVEDCIEGMLYAFRNVNEKPCDVFNLGTATNTQVAMIAHIVAEEMGLTGTKFRYTGGRRGWPGDQPRIYYDTNKMRQLGWQAKRSSTEAVRIAVKRLLQDDDGLRKLGGAQESA